MNESIIRSIEMTKDAPIPIPTNSGFNFRLGIERFGKTWNWSELVRTGTGIEWN